MVGALIQGQALSNGMFTEVALPRAPMRISVGAENLTGQASAELEAPSLSAYRDAVRAILSNGLQGSQAAQVNYSTETIHSEEHMALSMGADVNAGNVDDGELRLYARRHQKPCGGEFYASLLHR